MYKNFGAFFTSCALGIVVYSNYFKPLNFQDISCDQETVLNNSELDVSSILSDEKGDEIEEVKAEEEIQQPSSYVFLAKHQQNVVGTLNKKGFSAQDIQYVKQELKKHSHRKNSIDSTSNVFVKYSDSKKDNQNLRNWVEVDIPLSSGKFVRISRSPNDILSASIIRVDVKKSFRRVDGTINSSFYKTILKMAIPQKIVKETINYLSHIMNFQHGVKKGDRFEIMYEEQRDSDGRLHKVGGLVYVGFINGRTFHKLYQHSRSGITDFFDESGKSIRRSILQTPLDPRKMRVTSAFGRNRLHPIRGYRRDHKGVDFGAPTGTHVKAAGQGVVVKIGYYGDYGKYVKIRHGNGFETAYAHLSRFACNLKKGTKVSQNQVIGYVGSTGMATGPHLHFEVIKNGVHINPMTVKSAPSQQLSGRELKYFQQAKKNIEIKFASLGKENSSSSVYSG
ncbi:MAG: hypothetical protein C0432_05035 [Candidatus Puniceispirillum sp.]|nr:hypothetical protein [Candidatus Pelagibacter sp.]MBA4283639.1 hypothetical protein [Candidatus Puniceispirillum sp.]